MIDKKPESSASRTAFGDYSKGTPQIGASRVDPTVRAVGRKLLQPMHAGAASAPGARRRMLDMDHASMFARISSKTATSIVDVRNAFQLLPDLEIAKTLLVSSILSPKDLNTVELTYSLRSKVVRSELAQPLLEIIREHFETHHKLKADLTPMLEDALFMTGSYPMLVLAENSIDELINGTTPVSLESLRGELDETQNFRNVGFLGMPPEEGQVETQGVTGVLGLESFGTAAGSPRYKAEVASMPGLSVTDNPSILKMPALRERLRAENVERLLRQSKLRGSMESSGRSEADGLIDSLYRARSYTAQRQAMVPTTGSTKRATVGHPLVMKLPSESVIPVHEPANPSKHLGYFILLEQGSPVFKSTEADYYREMSNNYSQNNSMVSSMLREAKRVNQGYNFDNNTTDVHKFEQIYGDLVERELNERLKRGVYGAGATVARPTEVYRIMMARALAGKQTQLLYVPEEMLVYVAFDYTQHGTGVSLLQKSIILAGQRANLAVASTMAELKNAVSRSKLSITLDEEDDDPSTTVEHIITEAAKLRQGAYPMHISAPNDIVNWLQNAAVEIEVSGNTGYPQTKVDISDYSSQKIVPSQELQKDLRDRQWWSFGISPELVDAARGAEFATSIVNNNLMLTKNVMHYQELLTPFLEEFVRIYTLSDGILLERLREVLRGSTRNPATADLTASENTARDQIGGSDGNNVDRLIVDFLNDLQVDLPKPEGAKTTNLREAFNLQKEFVTEGVEMWISDQALSAELSGELGGQIEAVKGALVALWMRKWARENGMAEMFDELLELGENGAAGMDLFAEIEAHSNPIKINLRDFITKNLRRQAADDKVLNKVKEQTGADAAGGGGSFDTGGDTSSTGSDDFGDGGMDLDLDIGGETETSEESTETTETSEDEVVEGEDPPAAE